MRKKKEMCLVARTHCVSQCILSDKKIKANQDCLYTGRERFTSRHRDSHFVYLFFMRIQTTAKRFVCVFRSVGKRMTGSIYGRQAASVCLDLQPCVCVYIESASHGANSGMPLVFLKITVSMALVQRAVEWHSLNTDTSC